MRKLDKISKLTLNLSVGGTTEIIPIFLKLGPCTAACDTRIWCTNYIIEVNIRLIFPPDTKPNLLRKCLVTLWKIDDKASSFYTESIIRIDDDAWELQLYMVNPLYYSLFLFYFLTSCLTMKKSTSQSGLVVKTWKNICKGRKIVMLAFISSCGQFWGCY